MRKATVLIPFRNATRIHGFPALIRTDHGNENFDIWELQALNRGDLIYRDDGVVVDRRRSVITGTRYQNNDKKT